MEVNLSLPDFRKFSRVSILAINTKEINENKIFQKFQHDLNYFNFSFNVDYNEKGGFCDILTKYFDYAGYQHKLKNKK